MRRYDYNLFLVRSDIYSKQIMEDLTKKLTIIRTELNLEHDPAKRADLTKRLNVLLLQQEIETIKKRIEQMNKS